MLPRSLYGHMPAQSVRGGRGGDWGQGCFSCVTAVGFKVKFHVPSPEDGVAAGAGVTGAKPGLLFVEDAGDICFRDNCGRDAFCGSNDANGSSKALSFLKQRESLRSILWYLPVLMCQPEQQHRVNTRNHCSLSNPANTTGAEQQCKSATAQKLTSTVLHQAEALQS